MKIARSASSVAVTVLASLVAAEATLGAVTTRASVASGGAEGNSDSYNGSISGTGRYVVFQSGCSNFDLADPVIHTSDIYLRDTTLDTTVLVSVSSTGTLSNGYSAYPVVSDDGKFVAFETTATNLVAEDTISLFDIYVRDVSTGQTTLISAGTDGLAGDNASFNPSISKNGRYVAFQSDATNLVADDTNQRTDVFVHDRNTGKTTRVSVDSKEVQGASNSVVYRDGISGNGRYVVFVSESKLAANDNQPTSDIYIRDLKKGKTTLVSLGKNGAGDAGSDYPSVSDNGRYVAFASAAKNLVPGDGNNTQDIFLRDVKKKTTKRLSVSSAGVEGDGVCVRPAISGDGKIVAFESYSSNLVAGDAVGTLDAFVRDVKKKTTTAAVLTQTGAIPTFSSNALSLSKDGRYLVLDSFVADLIAIDGNNAYDVFIRDRK